MLTDTRASSTTRRSYVPVAESWCNDCSDDSNSSFLSTGRGHWSLGPRTVLYCTAPTDRSFSASTWGDDDTLLDTQERPHTCRIVTDGRHTTSIKAADRRPALISASCFLGRHQRAPHWSPPCQSEKPAVQAKRFKTNASSVPVLGTCSTTFQRQDAGHTPEGGSQQRVVPHCFDLGQQPTLHSSSHTVLRPTDHAATFSSCARVKHSNVRHSRVRPRPRPPPGARPPVAPVRPPIRPPVGPPVRPPVWPPPVGPPIRPPVRPPSSPTPGLHSAVVVTVPVTVPVARAPWAHGGRAPVVPKVMVVVCMAWRGMAWPSTAAGSVVVTEAGTQAGRLTSTSGFRCVPPPLASLPC